MDDYDVCIYCAATGCAMGTAQHARNCPFFIGIFPVVEVDLWHRMVCMRCSSKFKKGDQYALVSSDHFLDGVSEVVCLGCKVLIDGSSTRDF